MTVYQTTASSPFEIDWGSPQSRGLLHCFRDASSIANAGSGSMIDVVTGIGTTTDGPMLKKSPILKDRGYPCDFAANTNSGNVLFDVAGRDTTDSWMITFWFRWDTFFDNIALFAGNIFGNNERLKFSTNTTATFSIFGNTVAASIPTPQDTWLHLCAAIDESGLGKMWVDGVDVTTATTSPSIKNPFTVLMASVSNDSPRTQFADMRIYDAYRPAIIREAYSDPGGIEYAPQWVFPRPTAISPVQEFSGDATRFRDATGDFQTIGLGPQELSGTTDRQRDATGDLEIVPPGVQEFSGTNNRLRDATGEFEVIQELSGDVTRQRDATGDLTVPFRNLAGTTDRKRDATGNFENVIVGVEEFAGTATRLRDASGVFSVNHAFTGTATRFRDVLGDLTGVSTPSSGGIDYSAGRWRPDYKVGNLRPDYRR